MVVCCYVCFWVCNALLLSLALPRQRQQLLLLMRPTTVAAAARRDRPLPANLVGEIPMFSTAATLPCVPGAFAAWQQACCCGRRQVLLLCGRAVWGQAAGAGACTAVDGCALGLGSP